MILFQFYQMLISQFLNYVLSQLNKMNILLLNFDIPALRNIFFLNEGLQEHQEYQISGMQPYIWLNTQNVGNMGQVLLSLGKLAYEIISITLNNPSILVK